MSEEPNQGWGQQIDSVCLISNMSQEPIYIHSLLMMVRTHSGEYTESVTDFDTAQSKDSHDRPQEVTRQGPLNAGEQINRGTFRSLIRQTAKRHKDLESDDKKPIRTLEVENVNITVIASYGPEGGVIGAQRKFIVRGKENELMRPAATTTKTMAKNRARAVGALAKRNSAEPTSFRRDWRRLQGIFNPVAQNTASTLEPGRIFARRSAVRTSGPLGWWPAADPVV